MKRIICNRCGKLLQTELTNDQCHFTVKGKAGFIKITTPKSKEGKK